MLENEEYRQTAPLVNSSGDTIVLPSHRKNRRRPCFSSFDNTEALLSHSYFPQCNVVTRLELCSRTKNIAKQLHLLTPQEIPLCYRPIGKTDADPASPVLTTLKHYSATHTFPNATFQLLHLYQN
ncbi:hypothetical protein F2Q69_00041010 [Brassica cretica]|uniref:Uncharacterized protein n=1 Tax=Brassica cretica TaxID=69181 RepID=A0A8S9NQJ4_BRACR|nr:hypothetical protein F2Q69_00041012 [Brassica cretica]KAF3504878.1 hypothetical protein F2Q69_00041010 [Brassica cretica]